MNASDSHTSRGNRARLRRRPLSRHGAVLLAALVCIVVVGAIALSILRAAVDEQRQLRGHQREIQAERLAAAAIERAVVQLRGSAGYSGETWRIPTDEMGGRSAAVAVIRVEPVAARPQDRRLTVQADYPDDAVYRVRKTRDAVVTLK